MAEHNELGKEAEKFAVTYLIERQYEVLAKNWRFGKAEIDIIAIDHSVEELVIVEVKALSSDAMRSPEEAVKKPKRSLLIVAANEYITQNQIVLETRFDVISLIKLNSKWEINHIKNAFNAYE